MGAAAGADARFASLEATEAWIWQTLARACSDRRSAWRTPILATIGADGAPRARMLVLRAVEVPLRRLTIHSDGRSGKMAELAACPALAMTFYDPRVQFQVRVAGVATVLAEGPDVDRAWDRVPAVSRVNYRTLAPPGSLFPDCAPPLSDDGRPNFRLIRIAVQRFEFLWLAPDRHRRGAIQWRGDDCERSWLVP